VHNNDPNNMCTKITVPTVEFKPKKKTQQGTAGKGAQKGAGRSRDEVWEDGIGS